MNPSTQEKVDQLTQRRAALQVDWQYYSRKAAELNRSIKAIDRQIAELQAEPGVA